MPNLPHDRCSMCFKQKELVDIAPHLPKVCKGCYLDIQHVVGWFEWQGFGLMRTLDAHLKSIAESGDIEILRTGGRKDTERPPKTPQ